MGTIFAIGGLAFAVLLGLLCFAVRVFSLSIGLKRGAWAIRKLSGEREVVTRLEQPRRYWMWTTVELTLAAIYGAMTLFLLYIAVGLVIR